MYKVNKSFEIPLFKGQVISDKWGEKRKTKKPTTKMRDTKMTMSSDGSEFSSRSNSDLVLYGVAIKDQDTLILRKGTTKTDMDMIQHESHMRAKFALMF